MIVLPPAQLELVKSLLSRYVPECRVLVFGSRVSGPVKKHSDLDLAVVPQKPIVARRLSALKEAFSESRLPIKVDIVVWDDISDEFRGIIQNKSEVVQEANKE